MKRLLLLPVAILFLFSGTLFAAPLDVDVILDLLDAGVSEPSIQRFVERNHYTIQLTADDLVALKKAGASDWLIEFLQETEGAAGTQAEGETQTAPATIDESDGTVEAATYDSPDVYVGFGFGIGFGYPYYYYPYYYPSYYYPAYPFYSPYPCGSGYYPGYYPGGTSGTGVYSYWYRNQAGPKPRPSTGAGGTSTTNLSGRVLRSAPTTGTTPQVIGGASSTSARQSLSTPSHTARGGNGGVRSSQGSGASRGGGTTGVRGSQGGAPRSSGTSGVRGSQSGAPRSHGTSGVRGSQGSVPRSSGMAGARSSRGGGSVSRGGGMGGSRGGGGFHGGGRGGRR